MSKYKKRGSTEILTKSSLTINGTYNNFLISQDQTWIKVSISLIFQMKGSFAKQNIKIVLIIFTAYKVFTSRKSIHIWLLVGQCDK